MAVKKSLNTQRRPSVLRQIFNALDIYLLTAIDTMLFIIYALYWNFVKQKVKIEKRSFNNLRTQKKAIDFDVLVKNVSGDLFMHHEHVAFILRFVPTAVTATITWLIL